jgi:hypothetical protein
MSPSRLDEFDLALGKGRMLLAEGEEAAVVLEHRIRVALLDADRAAQDVFDGTGSQGLPVEKPPLAPGFPRPSACGSRRGP